MFTMLETMIPQMAKEASVTEQMKMTDQLRWVSMMNAIKIPVEELILKQMIFK